MDTDTQAEPPENLVLSVLVVEDVMSEFMLAKRALEESTRFSVIHASDVADATAVLDDPNVEVDLILLDLGLPGLSGAEAVAFLKERYPHTPIVVLTGSSDPTLCEAAMAAGASDWRNKDSPIGAVFRSMYFALATDNSLLTRSLGLLNVAHDLINKQDEKLQVLKKEIELLSNRKQSGEINLNINLQGK